jgi:hypothetical protein
MWPRKKKFDEKVLNMPVSLCKMVSAQHFVKGYWVVKGIAEPNTPC